MRLCMDIYNPNMNVNSVGNKAYNLNKMSKFAKLSNGFVLTSTAYDLFIKSNNLEDVIQKHLLHMFSGKENVKTTSRSLKSVIIKGRFSSALEKEIIEYTKKLNPPYIVRSSTTIEDSESASFAGLFDSILNVKKNSLENSIKKVFASLFNESALSYAFDNKIPIKKFKMSILIQEMINGDKFGTGFLFQYKKERVSLIESILKDLEGVTSGRGIPDLYMIKNNIVREYPAKIDIFNLFPFEIYDLVKLMEKSSSIEFPTDIEWAIKGKNVYLLQLRHLTQKVNFQNLFKKEMFSGLPVNSGKVEGKAVIWKKDVTNPDKLNKGKDKILVADYIPEKDSKILKEYGGIVTETGGITSHTAILTREYGIPCVAGIRDAIGIIHEGDIVYLDGDNGSIKLPERDGLSINRKYVPTWFDIKKFKLFRYKEDIVVSYFDKDKVIVSYGYNIDFNPKKVEPKNRLRDIVYKIMEKYDVPIVRTLEQICGWYGYILEFAEVDSEIKKEFQERISLRNTKNFDIIKQKKEEMDRIDMKIKRESEKNYKKYKKTKDKKYLLNALNLFYRGVAYGFISNFYIYYSFDESKMIKMNTKQRERVEMFIENMWKAPEYAELKRGDLYTLYEKIQSDIVSNTNIHFYEFTSMVAYLNEVKKHLK